MIAADTPSGMGRPHSAFHTTAAVVSGETGPLPAPPQSSAVSTVAAARAGVPGRAGDAAGRRVSEEAGYGEYFGHSFGHSLGLEVHEGPNAAPTEERILPRGAVISAEPGIYLPGRFGVRIEDVLYLTDSGAEDITRAPKELIIL
jgi:Xaa-Pro aminopeptidase